MRVFAIQENGKFREYVQTPFEAEHEEAVLEDWLEHNPDGILEDGRLLIIGRQINTDLGSPIDLLAWDNAVVVELKRDRTPRDTLAQALGSGSKRMSGLRKPSRATQFLRKKDQPCPRRVCSSCVGCQTRNGNPR